MYLEETAVYQDEDIFLTIENERDLINGVFVHNEMYKPLSVSRMKKSLKVWKAVVDYLHSNGIKNIYCLPVEDENCKWAKAFGFKYTGISIEGDRLFKL